MNRTRFFAEVIGKNQRIAKPNRTIAIQIKPSVIPCIASTLSELFQLI